MSAIIALTTTARRAISDMVFGRAFAGVVDLPAHGALIEALGDVEGEGTMVDVLIAAEDAIDAMRSRGLDVDERVAAAEAAILLVQAQIRFDIDSIGGGEALMRAARRMGDML